MNYQKASKSKRLLAFLYVKSPGFTVIELVMVMVLVGLISVAMISWPSKRIDLRAQARQLVADLRFVQSTAMSQQAGYRVNFAAGQYTLTDSSAATALLHPMTHSNTVSMPSGVILSTSGLSNGYVLFDENGTPYTDASGTLLSSNAVVTLSASGNSVTVTITPDTGKVEAST